LAIAIFITIFAFLFISTYAVEADADYCLRLKDKQPKVILKKKINDLKPIFTNIRKDFLECENYRFDTIYFFKFYEEYQREDYLSTVLFGKKISSKPFRITHINGITDDGERIYSTLYDTINVSKIFKFSPVMQLDYPKVQPLFFNRKYERKKEDLLQFKDKIIDVIINVYVRCLPELDTIYRTEFHARITEECE